MILRINRLRLAVVYITILVFSTGCGTLMNGTQHYLGIMSNPYGATVTVDNRKLFDTPITAVLDKKTKHTVKIELDGYLPYEVEISRKLNWLLAGVEFFFWPILVVDVITGGIYTLSPEQIQAELKKEDLGLIDQREILYISFVLEPATDMERIATLTKRPQLTK